MLFFLLCASFLIHTLTLTALYVLFQHVKKGKDSHIHDIDAIMRTYVEQMKKENDELQKALHIYTLPRDTNKEEGIVSSKLDHKLDVKEVSKTNVDDWNIEEAVTKRSEADSVETSLESRVLQLHRTGIPVDVIAKQLHCGKTEASLIIQFQQGK